MKNLLFLGFFGLTSFAYGNELQEQLEAKKREFSSNKDPQSKIVAAEFQRALDELKASKMTNRTLKKKRQVPFFKLIGQPFSAYYQARPVVLKFYRGHWCPYCIIELQAYERMLDKFKQAGGQVIALTPDRPFYIRKTKAKHALSFPIYQDKDNMIAKRFGLAFKLDPKVRELYKQFGIDLNESQGNAENELPLPGTYVIGRDGRVAYAFFDVDYSKRANPTEVLNALQNLR